MSQVHESLRSQPKTLPIAERVNFQSVFEGLFLRAFKEQLSPELRKQLQGIGVDLDKLQTAYPHSVFLEAIALGAAAWFPGEAKESAFKKLGVRTIEGFYETFLGKPLLALLKLMGPKRTIGRMKANFRSANNYVESKLVEVSPTEFQMWMNEAGDVRFFIAGVMERGVQMAGAPKLTCDIIATDEIGSVFRITL